MDSVRSKIGKDTRSTVKSPTTWEVPRCIAKYPRSKATALLKPELAILQDEYAIYIDKFTKQ